MSVQDINELIVIVDTKHKIFDRVQDFVLKEPVYHIVMATTPSFYDNS